MHLPGTIIDNRYQIIQKLGRSEREQTYLAKDLQTMVDAKCIVEQLDFDSENEVNWQIIQEYLFKEVTLIKRLGDHPQIPQIQHYFGEGQQFYLVREYIDGDNLKQEIERKKFDEAETVYLIQDGLRILDFIHKTNVLHRDVQPVHLLRRKQNQAHILINFGALRKIEAKEINLQGELMLSRGIGNPAYAAPEQKAGKFYFSSDIYALAKTAVYALTGRSPLELEQANLDWRSQCQISSKLEAILTKMMSPIVEHRYPSALDVLQDLRPLLKIKQLVGGRYLITSYLGGNEGVETYLANNLRRQYQSPCLIKQIELPHSDDNNKIQLERHFVEELSVLERLGYHEQIPQLRDHFEENDEFYLVQEYIQGKSLAQRIGQQNLSTAQIIQILDSSLSVLQFIHQNRLIHRNIKPSNLIVRELDQQVIITDFGILHEIKTRSNLVDNRSVDRQNYWPPEQVAGRPTISSDLYALGMTIIEALTGTKPVTFTREQNGKLSWEQNLNLDRRLIKIIDKLVQLDLGQRYPSADKVLSELRKINSYDLNHHPPKTQLQDVKTANRQPRSSLPLLIGLLGVICLLGSIEFTFPTVRPIYYWYQGQKLLPQQPQTALDRFTQAINLQVHSWRAWLGKGDALAAIERYPEALDAYIEATELNPDLGSSWQKRGDTLFRLDNFTEAIAAYNQALKLEPESAIIYNRKGQALFQLQQYEAALVMQDAALERDRLNPQFLSDRAKILFQLRQYSEALDLFNQVQAIKPDSLELWQDKFFVLKALNRFQEAEKIRKEINNNYIKITQERPQDRSAWIAQGDFLAATQMYNKAVAAYDQAIQLMPDNYRGWLGKGEALAQNGQGINALAALDRALQIRPQSYQAWQAKGMIYQQQNNLDQAIANYDQALKINDNIPLLWRNRGVVLNQQGRYTQAIESLIKASELSSHDVQIWRELAIAWSALGKDNQAISAIDRGLKFYPQNSALWGLKGSLQTKNAQYNQACDTYRSARAAGGASTIIIDSMRQLGCRLN
ncbi:MAG: tetratricopeptide repeat protein [Pleurocapsa sp. CRU_1_2]|nr:tetratricopeptide repeat protein [Pleurocapsa sp. CRU_1_2]